VGFAEYYKWLKRDWAKAGLILSIFLLIFLFVFVIQVDEVVFFILLQTPLYMLHQAEEYVIPGGFSILIFNFLLIWQEKISDIEI